MEKQIIPVIDTDFLQQKANEYAMKGAEDALRDFYTSYSSPYKKAIEENLNNKGVDGSFDIPDIIGVLNAKFSQQVDEIANTAIAKTFVPMVKKFLTREDAEIKFSEILHKFIERTDFKGNDQSIEDYTVEKITKYDESPSLRDTFFSYQISNGEIGYELSFYRNRHNDKEEITMSSLPYLLDNYGKYSHRYETQQKMKISLDEGVTLELPFVKGILDDDFTSFIARLVVGNNTIVFDVQDFDEDMFPNNHCHCD
ncbi:hypothetical protein [Elizabethkingia miricola]|uniref:hypothetical protein n=1 Tax=Elizabethkingia miricola TaxID=172045 RepID=UPI002ACEAB09|nr:hypothetical protein [Elizabethkingia miricola]WQM37642.1 hypothetical protein U2S95_14880 [Elizabethkingia miricola]